MNDGNNSAAIVITPVTNDRNAIEERAWNEYLSMLGKVVLVKAISGYVGLDSCDVLLDQPAKVRIGKSRESDVKRWNDCGAESWCDPLWEVSLVDTHPQLSEMRSLWIHGTCYLCDSDRTEASDVVEILLDAPPATPEAALQDAWERYDFGNDVFVENSSGWETTSGTGEWTRPVYIEAHAGDAASNPTEKVAFTVRLNPDNSIIEAYAITSSGNIVGSMPPVQPFAMVPATAPNEAAAPPASPTSAVAAAATTLKAYENASLMEGDTSILLFHLFADLHEFTAQEGIDLDAIWNRVRGEITSGEIVSPLWNARQHKLHRKTPRIPGTRG